MRPNGGADLQAGLLAELAITGGFNGGAATSVDATHLNDTGQAWTTNKYAGMIVAMVPAGGAGAVIAHILSNTGTQLVLDRMANPATPFGAVASTPSPTTPYVIIPAGLAAVVMALSTSATVPGASDTPSVNWAGEVNNASGNLNRAVCTSVHSAGSSSFTLARSVVLNANDGTPTVLKFGIFDTVVASVGNLWLETTITTATVTNGDTLAPTDTITD